MTQENNDQGIKFTCDLCGDLIEVGRPRFIFKGELYCGYEGDKFDETLNQTSNNLQEEIRKLMKAAEQKSEKELNDEVYYSFHLDLCRTCRDRMYILLEKKILQ